MKTDCSIWPGTLNRDGYGVIYAGGRFLAHRFIYETVIGPIPAGLVLDHLCRNRACVNPSHLEPVTNAENIARGAALLTHCKHGHPLDTLNVYWDGSRRRCRACVRRRQREYQERKAAAVAS